MRRLFPRNPFELAVQLVMSFGLAVTLMAWLSIFTDPQIEAKFQPESGCRVLFTTPKSPGWVYVRLPGAQDKCWIWYGKPGS